jgi:hypothetical protein
MKKSKLIFGISILVIGFTSCKDEKNDQAEKTVETYVVYVDSVETISMVKCSFSCSALKKTIPH